MTILDATSKIIRRAPVELAPRAAMTAARKRRVWEAHQGRCEECGKGVPMEGPLVAYDHIIPLALGGADTDANLQPLCTVPCHARKTAHDIWRIAKAKRQGGETGKATKRPIRSPSFDTTRSKGFDGKVRPREGAERS
jgi:hypothetical protein